MKVKFNNKFHEILVIDNEFWGKGQNVFLKYRKIQGTSQFLNSNKVMARMSIDVIYDLLHFNIEQEIKRYLREKISK